MSAECNLFHSRAIIDGVISEYSPVLSLGNRNARKIKSNVVTIDSSKLKQPIDRSVYDSMKLVELESFKAKRPNDN